MINKECGEKDRVKKCPHCEFIEKTFINHPDSTNREHWLMTEVFVYLHGKDSCTFVKDHTCNECGEWHPSFDECPRCGDIN
jgi:phage terminase large subunit GpA-like protein